MLNRLRVVSFVRLREAAIRRGSARAMDHAQLVHEQWLQAARGKFNLHALRVATDDNIADLPSREVRPRLVAARA